MIYTIGFTQSSAQHFFERLRDNRVGLLVDVRLNNHSQLAGFAKFPDIKWFLRELCQTEYILDDLLAPTAEILDAYRKSTIDWNLYEHYFEELMRDRNIDVHIEKHYMDHSGNHIALLCSEPTPEQCHRRLVAAHFSKVLKAEIRHL